METPSAWLRTIKTPELGMSSSLSYFPICWAETRLLILQESSLRELPEATLDSLSLLPIIVLSSFI